MENYSSAYNSIIPKHLTSSIDLAQVGKTPDVSKSHCEANWCKQVLDLVIPLGSLLHTTIFSLIHPQLTKSLRTNPVLFQGCSSPDPHTHLTVVRCSDVCFCSAQNCPPSLSSLCQGKYYLVWFSLSDVSTSLFIFSGPSLTILSGATFIGFYKKEIWLPGSEWKQVWGFSGQAFLFV